MNLNYTLANNGFIVPGIENVGDIRLTSTQVRYFRQEEDKTLANQVADILQHNGVENANAKYVPGYEDSNNIRPKHLEIWFANDAFSDAVNQEAK